MPAPSCRTTIGRIAITLSRAGKSIIVTVDDNGPGIRADNIDRIFERFYTDRPAGEAFGQNSGLGLSISRQIVEAHGGTLTAENIPGTKPGEITRRALRRDAAGRRLTRAAMPIIHATAVVLGDRGVLIPARRGPARRRWRWR